MFHRFLHTIPKMIAGTGSRGFGDLAPIFEPAIFGGIGVTRFDPRLMAKNIKQDEVCELIVFENCFEIELDIGCTGKSLVVTQEV